LNVV
jgi:hypothetical protein